MVEERVGGCLGHDRNAGCVLRRHACWHFEEEVFADEVVLVGAMVDGLVLADEVVAGYDVSNVVGRSWADADDSSAVLVA